MDHLSEETSSLDRASSVLWIIAFGLAILLFVGMIIGLIYILYERGFSWANVLIPTFVAVEAIHLASLCWAHLKLPPGVRRRRSITEGDAA